MFPSSFLPIKHNFIVKIHRPKLAIAISLIVNCVGLPTANATAVANTSCAPAPSSSLVVNVKNTGATGNDATDDTAAIQKAINQVAGTGGTVYVPDGTYMINALTSLLLQSDMTLSLSANAILKAIPNDQDAYQIILIENANNVNLIGGILQGERDQHIGTGGESGDGIDIDTSSNVTVQGVTSENNLGDGFYIGANSTNITFCSVTANNNFRHGASITSVNGMVIKNSAFNSSYGFAAGSMGLDIEPNPGETVNNVQVLNSVFQNNASSGIQASFPSLADTVNSFITNLTIQGNTISNNGVVGTYSAAINLSSQKSVQVLNNIVSNNAQDSILLNNNSTKNNIMGNTITGSGYNNPLSDQSAGYGILVQSGSTLNTITHNIVKNNETGNIVDQVGGNRINTNTVN